MTARAEWVAAQLAAAPELSPAQIAVLRPLFRPVTSRNADAAPARQQEPHQTALASQKGTTSARS